MELRKLLIVFASVLGVATMASAQTGTISGKITEEGTNEPVEGATIKLMQDSTIKGGGYSDENGEFDIRANAGTYTVVFSYISYADKSVEGVTIPAGGKVVQNAEMGMDVDDDGEKNVVVISEKLERNTETVLITMRRRSTTVMDAISAEQVKRAGDSDVGGAMKRVTGVSVEGGKYVYVRGLGDRYSKTMLNGSELPGLDPDRNSVQMDMFPSSLIDNLVVHKTFSPDMPGSFSGGLVKISTTDFPNGFAMRYSSSVGFNTQASLRKDFLTGERGKLEWLGFDDGTRALPASLQNYNSVPNLTFNDAEQAAELDAASNAFGTPVYPVTSNSGLNNSHSFSIGNQTLLFGKPFGYVASVSYRNNQSMYDNGVAARWKLTNHVDNTETLNNDLTFTDVSSTRETLLGSLVNLSWLPSENHKFSLNLMDVRSGQSSARYMEGKLPDDDPNLTFQTRVAGYKERSMDAAQLKGDHTFAEKLKMDWAIAGTYSIQNEPDLRFFSNDYVVNGSDTIYDIQRNLYNAPGRFFREMSEVNLDNRVNFELPVMLTETAEAKIKFGGAYTLKARDFAERRFEYVNGSPSTVTYNGDPSAFFAPENMGLIGTDANGLYQWGNYLVDATELRNTYKGSQSIGAAYGMVELPLIKRMRLVTGARMETTNISVESADFRQPAGTLDNLDILPAASLTYALNEKATKNMMNLRASYSKTLARPTFRGLAPYASFEFVRDFVLVGNDTLKRTLIDNFDLRWEMYPTTRELVSVSAFYKNFENPIERVINPRAGNTELNYRNVAQAQLYGVEFEFRKTLGFISPSLENFRASGNLTLIKSFLDINSDELALIQTLNPYASTQREMFGQSPYTINGELAYVNDTLGLTSSLNFNVFGARISNVSVGGTPNVYEQPRPSLDFGIGKSWDSGLGIRFRARNLLNPEYKQVQTFKGEDYVFQSYRIGRTFSLAVSYTFQRKDN